MRTFAGCPRDPLLGTNDLGATIGTSNRQGGEAAEVALGAFSDSLDFSDARNSEYLGSVI